MTPDEAKATSWNLVNQFVAMAEISDAQCEWAAQLVDWFAAALLEAAGQWMPIAAHDGTSKEVLGMDAKGHVEKTWYFAPSSSTKNWLRFRGNKPWNPTHWRHLPAPPETDA